MWVDNSIFHCIIFINSKRGKKKELPSLKTPLIPIILFSPRTEMTAENLRWLENVFRRTVGENGEIRLQDFKNIVHSKNVSHFFQCTTFLWVTLSCIYLCSWRRGIACSYCCLICLLSSLKWFQPFFVERVFHIFDKDDNGSISLQEFIDAMHQFAGQSPDDKIKFLFKVYDIDGKDIILLHAAHNR